MEIRTIRNGSTVLVAYGEGKDNRQIQSKVKPEKAWKEAWDALATDYKCILAQRLGIPPEKLDAFHAAHVVSFNRITYNYKPTGEISSYEVHGHHRIMGVPYDTDIGMTFIYAMKDAHGKDVGNAPDKAAKAILDAAAAYVQSRLQDKGDDQPNLFEKQEEAAA